MIDLPVLEGATPLTPEELAQLIPSHLTTSAQLDEMEQLGIARTAVWALGRRQTGILGTPFAQGLHQRMFSDVWQCAGRFRTTGVKIGDVPAPDIPVRLRQLFDDATYWIENDVFGTDETAVRLHHGLTVIHPFPNGNGRHARLLTDVFLKNADRRVFTWGGGDNLVRPGDTRRLYLEALRAADRHDIDSLLDFVRS